MIHRVALALLGGSILVPLRLLAQDLTADLTGYESGGATRTGWKIGLGAALDDPVGYRLFALHQSSSDPVIGDDYGIGGDVTLFERGRPGPYLVGGMQLGARDRSGAAEIR